MHYIGTICTGDYTVALYFSTKSFKIVVNPNNDIPFTSVSCQLNILTVFVPNLHDFVFTRRCFLQKAK